ncbi:MAG: hypothetical protein IIB00_06575 [candidate division Zixibacteria bacterium]|nr:hypothetical protein [candidate division Zixibacteria bacterium]
MIENKSRAIPLIGILTVLILCPLTEVVYGGTFYTNRDSAAAWTRDADLREQAPVQNRGTLPSLSFGWALIFPPDTVAYHVIMQDTLVSTGDTTSDGDGIPAGMQITDCTLWVEMSVQALNGTEIIFDIHALDSGWNENDGINAVSWDSSRQGQAWTTPGGTKTLVLENAFSYQKIDADSFYWRTDVGGILTKWKNKAVIVGTGDSFPIPIPLSVAQGIYQGTTFGALFRNQDSLGVTFQIISSEHTSVAGRPIWSWNYTDGKTPIRRRRALTQESLSFVAPASVERFVVNVSMLQEKRRCFRALNQEMFHRSLQQENSIGYQLGVK